MEGRILEFSEWKNLREGSSEKIVNTLSKFFGGRISKLDSILSSIKKSHSDYSDEWEEVITDIDALEVERTQTKSDPAEIKRIDRMISRKKQLLQALNVKKSKDIRNLEDKAQKIYDKNARLKSYWEVETSKLSAELAEDMYKRAKDLSDDSVSKELYSKYEEALLKSKERDESFRKKYGKLSDEINGRIGKLKNPIFNFSLDPYLKMDHSSFESEVKNMENDQINALIKYLRIERNERYAMMDTERESLEKKMPNSPGIKAKIRDLSGRYMDEIRDLRTKITIAKKYA